MKDGTPHNEIHPLARIVGLILAFICIIGLGLALSSCSPPYKASEPREPRVLNEAPPEPIYDFFLDDGTRCVYVNGVREGGLSCDFDANRRRAE